MNTAEEIEMAGGGSGNFDVEGSKPEAKSKFRGVARSVTSAKRLLSTKDENSPERKELIAARRRQHLGKFGRVKTQQWDEGVERASSSTEKPAVALAPSRDSAARVLYKAGVKKITAKPNVKSTWEAFGGRSFARSDWQPLDDEDDDWKKADEKKASGEKVQEKFSFFSFDDSDLQQDEKRAIVQASRPEEEVEKEQVARAGVPPRGPSRGRTGVVETESKRVEKQQKQKKKAWFLFGNLLNRKMRRGVSKKLANQFDDKREYFTMWLSFVQVVILIVVLVLYPLAPIGKDVKKKQEEVLLSRQGVLMKEQLQRKVVESFWIGPSLERLILLGAKYAPCMRRDKKVYAEIAKERIAENKTGCCRQTVNTGCIQRHMDECISSSTNFDSQKVCGQDPKFCKKAAIPPARWSKSIVEWPICEKPKPGDGNENYPHMNCEVTARPCCVKSQGQCVITTQANCKFWDGLYNADATLCSQVDCLSATCGNSFSNNDYPDQFYRIFTSLFLSAGILHLIVILVFNFTILRDIEGYAGWFRTALIFILTGSAGNLWSALLLPYQAEVGENGAMFGIFACVFVEGIQNWELLEKPWLYMVKLIAILVVLLLFGLLPYIDNFAHIFGFIYGILLGFVILPSVVTDLDPEEARKDKRNGLIRSVIFLILAIVLTIVALGLFYVVQDTQSKAISLFNCPLGEKFCQNFHQGQALESRTIVF